MKMSQEGNRHRVLVCLFVCVRKAVDTVSYFVAMFVCVRKAVDIGSLFVCLFMSRRQYT
jgi:hypothetical protein